MPAAAAVRAAAVRAEAARRRPRGPPPPGTVAVLTRVLALSSGPPGAFLLGTDPAVDLGVLRDPDAVAAIDVHSGVRAPAAAMPLLLSNMHVPFVNLGKVNIGLAIGRVERVGDWSGAVIPVAGGAAGVDGGGGGSVGGGGGAIGDVDVMNIMSRLMVMGRYARDEETGEMLTILTDLSTGSDAVVSLLWLGPAVGEYVRERVDIVCDAAMFSEGRIAESVIRCERTVRVGGGQAAGLLPTSPMDMRNCGRNMGHLTGLSQDFVLGLPAFEEQMEASDDLVRHQLILTAVQCKVAQIPPGTMGVSVGVQLYQVALQASLERLTKMSKYLSGAECGFAANDAATVVELNEETLLEGGAGSGADGSGLVDGGLGISGGLGLHGGPGVGKLSDPGPVLLDGLDPNAMIPALTGWNQGGLLSPSLGVPWLIDHTSIMHLGRSDARELGCDREHDKDKAVGEASFSRVEPPPTLPNSSSHVTIPPTTTTAAAAAAAAATATATKKQCASSTSAARLGVAGGGVTEAAEARKALRRAKNIEAARRSNQRRKRAYDELCRVVELARKTEAKLRAREAELVIENAALRLLISRAAEGRQI
jgi:hypothetical protein